VVAKRLSRRSARYERSIPGELVHADTKRPPYITGESKATRREVLFVSLDDHSRYLVADVLPDRTQDSAAVFGAVARERFPFPIECWYTDNGTEWTGTPKHAFVAFCNEAQIRQNFTKVRHPWTNGKAERVIRTLLSEWFRKERFLSREERRRSLYRFVDWYNHQRPHLGMNGQTPVERLRSYWFSGDNA
jgi:transposase InsO family protein